MAINLTDIFLITYICCIIRKNIFNVNRAKKPVPTPRRRPSSEVAAASLKSVSTAQLPAAKTTSEPPQLNLLTSTVSSKQNPLTAAATVVASAASPSFSQTKGTIL